MVARRLHVGLVVCALAVAAVPLSSHGEGILGVVFPEQRRMQIRSPSQLPAARLPNVPPPATVLAEGQRQQVHLSLDEAIRIALANSEVVRVLTGSGATGRAVARELADHGVPSTMELSGCDAVFVLPGADLDLVARGLRFGVTLNGGATCIAPRRLFVSREDADDVERRIVARLSPSGPIPAGADAIERAAAAVRAAVSRGARIAAGGGVEGAAMEPTLSLIHI